MNENELDEIISICDAEYKAAKDKLDNEELTVLQVQYYLGKKHTALDIMDKIKFIKTRQL
jgi:hypothetical protein